MRGQLRSAEVWRAFGDAEPDGGEAVPFGVFLRPRMERYRGEESKAIMALVEQTGAAIQQVSVDEAYLDFSAVCGERAGDGDAALERAVPMARALQERIVRERQLTSSIGRRRTSFWRSWELFPEAGGVDLDPGQRTGRVPAAVARAGPAWGGNGDREGAGGRGAEDGGRPAGSSRGPAGVGRFRGARP